MALPTALLCMLLERNGVSPDNVGGAMRSARLAMGSRPWLPWILPLVVAVPVATAVACAAALAAGAWVTGWFPCTPLALCGVCMVTGAVLAPLHGAQAAV